MRDMRLATCDLPLQPALRHLRPAGVFGWRFALGYFVARRPGHWFRVGTVAVINHRRRIVVVSFRIRTTSDGQDTGAVVFRGFSIVVRGFSISAAQYHGWLVAGFRCWLLRWRRVFLGHRAVVSLATLTRWRSGRRFFSRSARYARGAWRA